MIHHAIGFGNIMERQGNTSAMRAKAKKGARISGAKRGEPKKKARELWDSLERKPNGWKAFQTALARASIETTEPQARRWYTTFQKLAQ